MTKITIANRRVKCPACGGDKFSLDVPPDTKIEDVVSGKVKFNDLSLQCQNCYKWFDREEKDNDVRG